MRTFDAVVIGLGAHGSAAALSLARRGLRVVGVEAGPRGHELGSSSGRSRMIRRAYFEHPAYSPLLDAAFAGWATLGEAIGRPLVDVLGGFYAGASGSVVLQGSIASAVAQGIEHEVLDAAEARRRWPAFELGDEFAALYDPGAGMIRPEVAIEAQLVQAERAGAELRFGERAIDWRPGAGGGIEVETGGEVLAAGHLVIAAGAWTNDLVPDLALPLEVERIPVVWFEPDPTGAAGLGLGRLPVWIVETEFDGAFYGFPYDPATGLKVTRHYSEDFVEPDAVDRAVSARDVDRIRAFSRRHMPIADAPVRGSTVCLYTDTPDRHFVLDTHPAVAGVAFASACSGHGFKFAPVIGEILADLALTGSTDHPIGLFRVDRFARA
jgi:sarcosine oxidase